MERPFNVLVWSGIVTSTLQAVLLAAGPANRLLPLTEGRPKGMLLIGGKPLLQHSVEALKANGIDELVMVIGAHGEKIQSFFKDGADFGVKIHYAHQAKPTGTLDALRLAIPHLPSDAPALVMSGHVFVDAKMIKPLVGAKQDTVLIADAGQGHEQGIPTVRGDRLAGMHKETPVVGSTRVSSGIVRASQPLLQALAGESLRDQSDLDLGLGHLAGEGHEIRTSVLPGAWHTVVEPWDVLRLNERILEKLKKGEKHPRGPHITGAVHLGEHTTVAPSATIIGPVTIGDGCTIGDYTVVGPYVSVRNNTVIGSHCEVRRSILNNNVFVDSRSIVRGAILDDGVQVAPGFIGHEESTAAGPVGCILGRDAVIGAGVRLGGGTVVDPEARMANGKKD